MVNFLPESGLYLLILQLTSQIEYVWLLCHFRISTMIKFCQPSLVKVNTYKASVICRKPRCNVRINCIHRHSLPVIIVRKTVENMINRMIHISQPNHFWCGNQTDMYCVGMEDTNESMVYVAFSCVVIIIVLYIILVLIRKYEKEHEKY